MKKFISVIAVIAVMFVAMNAVVNAAVEQDRENARAISNNAVEMGMGKLDGVPKFSVRCYLPDGTQDKQTMVGVSPEVVKAANSGECYVVLL